MDIYKNGILQNRFVDVTTGTIDSITNIAGGTVVVGSIANVGAIHNAGTVAALPDLPGGTVDVVSNMTSGSVRMTVGTVTVLPDLPGGTVDVVSTLGALPDIPGGTVDLITSVTEVANLAGGTLDVGTVVVSTIADDLPGGTIDSVTAIGGLPDLPGGTVDLITAVSSVTNLVAGTITALAKGTVSVGTVFGGAAPAAARSGNPIPIAGTDSGGTVYIPKVDSSGNMSVTGGGGGTQFDENATHQTGDGGNLVFGVRQDSQADFGDDGGYVPLSVDADGLLRTSAAASASDTPGGTLDLVTALASGTITAGTVNVSAFGADIPGGTIDSVTAIGGLPDLPGGTVDSIVSGSLSDIAFIHTIGTMPAISVGDSEGGTLDTLGTVGSISNIGAIHNAGTIAALPDLPGGTIDSVTAIAGLPDLPGGTVDLITAVSSVTALAKGTVSDGTITNLLKTEDVAHSTGALGNMPLAVRVDGGTSLVSTTLDYAPLQVDALGALRIVGTVTTGAAGEVGGGTLDTLGTVGSISDIGVIHNAGTVAAVTTVTEVANLAGGTIDVGTVVVSTIADDLPGGTIDLVTAVTSLTNLPDLPGGTVDLVQALAQGTISAGTITNLLKAEDAAAATGDLGVNVFAVRVDGGTSLVNTTLDYAPLQVDANGALRVVGTTVTTLGDLSGGTIDLITAMASGTITAGTVNVSAFGADIPGGTTDLVTTVTNLTTMHDGTVVVSTIADDLPGGTIDSVTAVGALPDLPGGTIDLITGLLQAEDVAHTTADTGVMPLAVRVDAGTSLASDTLDYAPLQVDAAGALRIVGTTVTTLGDISGGTIDLITNQTDLGSVANLAVVHNAGTIAALPDLPGGTVDLVTAVTTVTSVANVAAGTITSVEGLPDLPGGTVDLVTNVTNLNSGSVRMTVGTVTVLPDLPGGTIDAVTSVANVAGGTLQVDQVPARPVISYGTLGTTAAEVRGTLVVAAGAGDEYLVSGCSIVVTSGTVVCGIEFGTKAVAGGGADVLAWGNFVPGGGIVRDFSSPPISPANGTLTYYMGGAGTAQFNVQYTEIV